MKATKVRQPVFAGSWYPANASDCEREIRGFLEEGQSLTPPDRNLVAGIVPHAGWYFSGSIACNVIQCLKGGTPPDAIVVFGMHLHPDSACYMMAEGAWETPLGEIVVEERLAAELNRKFAFTIETPQSFNQDNTIELQLPFIKYFFEDAKILAMGVPPNKSSLEIGRAVAAIASQLAVPPTLPITAAITALCLKARGSRLWTGCATKTIGASSMQCWAWSPKRSLPKRVPARTPVAPVPPLPPLKLPSTSALIMPMSLLMPLAMTNPPATALWGTWGSLCECGRWNVECGIEDREQQSEFRRPAFALKASARQADDRS